MTIARDSVSGEIVHGHDLRKWMIFIYEQPLLNARMTNVGYPLLHVASKK